MRTYKIIVSYDGKNYQGWQRQSTTGNTIQGILEGSLSDAVGYPVRIHGSGRTDAGVHALGQTASFEVSRKLDEENILLSLQENLPSDICVYRIELVKNGFHARLSAAEKKYEYHIDRGIYPDVFWRKYAFHHPKHLDVEKMRHAAMFLLGSHCFSAFCDKKEEKSNIRDIYAIEFREEGNLLHITYHGNGFLYHMVRILTGTLLEVGRGEKTAEDIPVILAKKKRENAGFLAPAHGLFLKEVIYKKTKTEDRE
ncbi:tRNA pseudouridine(38-40) synthase TruA [Lachnoclostridium sp. An181]|uniref:tRNA pseudouridine(38-40) synthase TruA n=1 Tax=Lachnoclostridium sp. An181 TaxID=1965575 RepID=UPI000B371BF7|nr:tRNA pseudouridine(38-40) synthase TruA [Lachnoclostridium sp. An181]OUP49133.1 tRNA pseudouridine(38-40) synthase TruA [Lachnoclostridium sp. An181]